eukprot:762474-Hanusia_phi.AAC.2
MGEEAKWSRSSDGQANVNGEERSLEEAADVYGQVRVQGDLKVTKFDKFWGQGEEETREKSFSAPLGELEYLLDRKRG